MEIQQTAPPGLGIDATVTSCISIFSSGLRLMALNCASDYACEHGSAGQERM